MGYFKHRAIVAVPADKIEVFNSIMQKHGYGPGNLTKSSALADKGGSVATHYVLEVAADTGLLAALKLALSSANDKVSLATQGKLIAEVGGNDPLKPTTITLTEKLLTTMNREKVDGGVKPGPVNEGETRK